MKRFIAFVIKEFRHLIRDPRTVFVLLFIPVIQLLLFGFVISTEIKDVRIAVLDLSNDEFSERLVNKIQASAYFQIDTYLHSTTQIEKLFQQGNIKEVIVFENGFARKLISEGVGAVQIITDASDPNTATLIDAYTRNIIQSFINEEFNVQQAGLISAESRMFFNESLRSAYLFVPGTMALILMLISALMTSVSIARERELGTMEILLVSPLRPIQIILGKLIPYLCLSFVDMLLIITIGYFVFHVPIGEHFLLLILTGTLFIMLALALGVLISTVAKTQQVAMIISLIGLMLPTVLLSGFIFPIENMPKILQAISIIMPPRWFLDAVKGIMLKDASIAIVWKELAIMCGMLVFFVMLSVRKFKIRLE